MDATPEVLEGLENWRSLRNEQQPNWPDQAAVDSAVAELSKLPPLVFAGEADKLVDDLAAVYRGEAFVLQGGDCAETFSNNTADRIRSKIMTILQMAAVLTYGASVPVVKMGRMAGQYAKPRSTDTETIDGVTLPSYRGDAVNAHAFTEAARTPDPQRLVHAYHHSASALNLIRAFAYGGFADLRHVHEWNKGFIRNPAYSRFEVLAAEIDRAIRFMRAAGVDFDAIKTVDMYSSHEALLLAYERALTRIDSRTGLPYDTSAHFVWIGERTRQLDGGHVDLLSRVRNPLGVKLGPAATAAEAVALAERLNPDGVPGRLTFIGRMGSTRVRELLPPLIEAVRDAGIPVVWVCDPMHGNTIQTNGYKTRQFEAILDEVKGFFEVHDQLGTHPGGLHVELTGDDVTEVLGGAEEVNEERLAYRYETVVDPRLNHQQALEMSFAVAEMLRD
ncbi:MAG TPA: 3-deoxy-7-phosphoheptulonate synthase class II [Actinomycetaceae bacterium]|nr:3-deoxy-7-phosphoheptulonate synthase class II [Actinomycetaceae bacterium]